MGKLMMKRTNYQEDQNGLASIIIVIVIIAILSLLTIGFAKVMDREYHQAIDRDLASQANYAAESGMNDARAYVIDSEKNGSDPTTTNGCKDLSGASQPVPNEFVKNGSISAYYANPGNPSSQDNNVKYTCVLIDTHPYDLNFNIKKGDSRVVEIVPGSPISNLLFSWQNQNATSFTALGAPYNLPKETAITTDVQTGLLRTTLYPAVNAGAGDSASDAQNANVASASRTYFMYPNTNGSMGQFGLASYNNASQQGFVKGECNTGNNFAGPLPYKENQYFCNSKVINMGGGPSFLYVRLTALYQNLSVTIEGTDASGNAVKLNDAQAVIDVTGEGNNILKRIGGRLSLSNIYNLPNDALQSMDTICKKQRLPETGPGVYSGAVLDPTEPNPDGACQL